MSKIFILLFMMVSVIACASAMIQVRLVDPVLDTGLEESSILIGLDNQEEEDYDDAQVSVYMPELDAYMVSGDFDLGDGNSRIERFRYDTSGLAPDYYIVRLSAHSDKTNERKVKYTWISLI